MGYKTVLTPLSTISVLHTECVHVNLANSVRDVEILMLTDPRENHKNEELVLIP